MWRWCAILVLGLAACAGMQPRVEPLTVTLADIHPAQFGLLEQEYAIQIRVQNPNNTQVRIDGLSYQIDLNDDLFAKGVSRQATVVEPFGEVMLDATAVGNLGSILNQFMQMQKMSGPPENFRYRLRGKLASGQLSLPFDSQGKIEVPSLGDVTK